MENLLVMQDVLRDGCDIVSSAKKLRIHFSRAENYELIQERSSLLTSLMNE